MRNDNINFPWPRDSLVSLDYTQNEDTHNYSILENHSTKFISLTTIALIKMMVQDMKSYLHHTLVIA